MENIDLLKKMGRVCGRYEESWREFLAVLKGLSTEMGKVGLDVC